MDGSKDKYVGCVEGGGRNALEVGGEEETQAWREDRNEGRKERREEGSKEGEYLFIYLFIYLCIYLFIYLCIYLYNNFRVIVNANKKTQKMSIILFYICVVSILKFPPLPNLLAKLR